MVCFLTYFTSSIGDMVVIIHQELRLRYGVKNKINSIKVILSDGSQVVFKLTWLNLLKRQKRKQLRKFHLQEIIRRAGSVKRN
jgi:hypothetical protein